MLCNTAGYFYLFIIIYFATHNEITSRIKTIINRLINIKFEICALLGRSDCGGEISEKPSLFTIELVSTFPSLEARKKLIMS